MTTKELRRLCKKWQSRLRLNDWSIWIRFANRGEHPDAWGLMFPQSTTKEATIIIQNPRWYKNTDPDYYQADVEVTIVHELCHIYFVPFKTKPGSHLDVVEEQIVSALSQLLVALDRRDELVMSPQNPEFLPKVARFHDPKDTAK